MTPASVRYLKALCVGSVAILVAIACGNPTPQSSNLAANQTLTFPILADFGTLDPAVSDAETDQEIQQNMFDGLVKFDNNLAVVPDIAASMPTVAADGLTYTFKLRTDVTFSNGDKVTSKDVLYSWNRSAAMQGAYATNLSAIDGYDKVSKNTASGAALEALLEKNDPSVTLTGLTAPDSSTVVVKMSAPAGWFLPAIALSGSTGEIVDINAVKQDFDNWWTNPATAIGTGPFKMTSRVPKQSVDFAAVSNWWGSPKPTLTKVHLDVSVTDASTAITKYEQGGYDVYGYGGYSNMPVADIKRIQATPNEVSQLLLQPKVRSYWVSFNMVHDTKRTAVGPFLLARRRPGQDAPQERRPRRHQDEGSDLHLRPRELAQQADRGVPAVAVARQPGGRRGHPARVALAVHQGPPQGLLRAVPRRLAGRLQPPSGLVRQPMGQDRRLPGLGLQHRLRHQGL